MWQVNGTSTCPICGKERPLNWASLLLTKDGIVYSICPQHEGSKELKEFIEGV